MKDDKLLYTCESFVDYKEYKKFSYVFPSVFYKNYIIKATLLNLLILFINLYYNKFLYVAITFIILEIIILIMFKLCLHFIVEIKYKLKYKDKKIFYNLDFYDDYFVQRTDDVSAKIDYDNISKSIETDDDFFLYSNKKNAIFIIQKYYCDLELISFIRKRFSPINELGKKIIRSKHYKDSVDIEKKLNIYFILTILSYILYTVVNELFKRLFGIPTPKWSHYVFLLFLPIPIISIVVGFKYKKKEFNCKKNIICGFIVLFMLLTIGLSSISFDKSLDYDKVYEYQDIIKVLLPKDGLAYQYSLNNEESENYKKINYSIINVDYSNVNTSDFINNIKNSDKWFDSKDINIDLKMAISSYFYTTLSRAYLLVYNETLNEYNIFPKEKGTYLIYIAKYDTGTSNLQIHKFNYILY